MDRRILASHVLTCLLALAIGASCRGQGAPRQLEISIVQSASLDAAQKQRVDEYATYWCGQMTSADPTSVETARKELMRPLTSVVQPSAAFRFEYSQALVPELTPLLQDPGQPHATLNAAIVLGELASRRALDVLITHADSQTEPNREVRIQASMNVEKALIKYSNDPNVISPRDLGAAIRDLKRAATREDDPIILHHQLRGLQAVRTQEAQDAAIDVLEAVAKKIGEHQGNISPLIRPFYEAITTFRNEFVSMSPQERARIGTKLGGVLDSFFTIVAAHWDEGHADPELLQRAANPIYAAEAYAKLVVKETGGEAPATNLRQHWEAGDKDSFEKDVSTWNKVFQQPPFTK